MHKAFIHKYVFAICVCVCNYLYVLCKIKNPVACVTYIRSYISKLLVVSLAVVCKDICMSS